MKVKNSAASANSASRVQAIVFCVVEYELQLLHLPAKALSLYTTLKVRTLDFSSNLTNTSHDELQTRPAVANLNCSRDAQ
jgi:hypothetical protein